MADAKMETEACVRDHIILEKLGASENTPIRHWVFDLKHDGAVTNIQIRKSEADAAADDPPLLELDNLVDERDIARTLYRDVRHPNGADLLCVESFPAFTGGGITARFGESLIVHILPDACLLVLDVRGETPRTIHAPELDPGFGPERSA